MQVYNETQQEIINALKVLKQPGLRLSTKQVHRAGLSAKSKYYFGSSRAAMEAAGLFEEYAIPPSPDLILDFDSLNKTQIALIRSLREYAAENGGISYKVASKKFGNSIRRNFGQVKLDVILGLTRSFLNLG